MKRMNVRMLVISGLMIAFSVVLSRFASFRLSVGGVENIRFGLGTLPIMLAGILFGPLMGGIVGICADLLGMVVSPIGTYLPHFTFVSMLYGFIPPLFCFPFQIGTYKTKLTYRLRVYTGIFLGQFIPQLVFLPYFLVTLLKIPFKASFYPRLITVPIQFLLCLLVLSFLLHVTEESILRG